MQFFARLSPLRAARDLRLFFHTRERYEWGFLALSVAITNWLLGPLWVIERIVLVLAALLLIAPEPVSTAIGFAILAAVTARQYLGTRSAPAASSR